jgi:hypothetical protein
MEIDNPAIVNNSWQGVSFFLLDTTGNYIERAYWGKNWGNEFWGFIGDFGALNYPSIYSSYYGIAWLVGKIVMSGDEQSERAYVWVDPDPSVEPDTLEASAAGFTQMSEGFNQVVCHLGQTEGIFCWYDEVRVGTSFADVTSAMTSVPQQDNELPTRFELSQNYPNPFNPMTTISFNLPKSENITLKIYNLAGQEIETLVNRYFSSGTHKVQWNASGKPSGIYFYNLQAGDYSATRKLILQK